MLSSREKEEAARAELLLRVLCDKIKKHGRGVLRSYRLSPPQFEVLVSLYFDGELRQLELSKKLHLAKSTVSALLDRLEKGGFISRRTLPSDKRQSTIRLTFKGLSVIEAVVRRRQELLARLLGALEPEERAKLLDLLSKMNLLVETEKQ